MSTQSADDLVKIAKDERCLLREKWEEQGAGLPGREQLALAKGLAKIKPATVERHGRRVPCESRFELRPKDRRRLVEALIADDVSDGEILSVVPGLTQRTFERLKADTGLAKTAPANGFPERRISTKRETPVGAPWLAYLDATSGGDLEAEKRFRELLGEAA